MRRRHLIPCPVIVNLEDDLAIIRPQQQIENGEIAAVIIQDMLPEATLKMVRRNRRTLSLEPAKRAYSAMIFKGDECGKVSVLGKCVGIIRRPWGRAMRAIRDERKRGPCG